MRKLTRFWIGHLLLFEIRTVMLPSALVEKRNWKEKSRQWNDSKKAGLHTKQRFQIWETSVTKVRSQGKEEKDSKAKKCERLISGLKLWSHFPWHFYCLSLFWFFFKCTEFWTAGLLGLVLLFFNSLLTVLMCSTVESPNTSKGKNILEDNYVSLEALRNLGRGSTWTAGAWGRTLPLLAVGEYTGKWLLIHLWKGLANALSNARVPEFEEG